MLVDVAGSDDGCQTQRPHKKRRGSPKELLQEVFWPKDLLAKAIPQARIVTWGYDVQVEQMFSSASQATIFHHAQALLSDLIMTRPFISDKQKPLIFIAHSLGGIIVKDALNLSRNDLTHLQEILPAVKGVIFLGTPHHGSRLASLGKVAFELSRLFFQKPNLDVLSGLERNSEILDRITRGFGQVLAAGSLKVHSFREELDTNGVTIVDSSSSSIGYLHETTGTLHANHRNMAKMSSLDDIKFKRVLAVIRRWIEGESGRQELPRVGRNTAALPDGLIFDEEYQNCLRSLNSVKARSRIQNVDDAYSHTYEWIFDPEFGFQPWLSGKDASPKFWIQGKPGSGKSTLMKFAKDHPVTRELLGQYHNSPWIIAAYFFHDRGIEVQKSILGFLREIVYQIMRQQTQLFPLIYDVFRRQHGYLQPATQPSMEIEGGRKVFADSMEKTWGLSLMQDALIAIASSAVFPVNICIFVDALDEHDGNHRDLLSTLDHLTRLSYNKFFHLRLCMAGRQENIFRVAFRDCPGFAIHELTRSDICQYTEGRLKNAASANLTEDGELALSGLIDDVVDRAEGVFLWVRLVVDELIEGLCEGDSMEELQDLLYGLPTELEELYTRTLHRPNRLQARTPGKFKYERYIMFQIVICCHRPFTLYELLAATLFLTTGKGTYPELQRLSEEQMERRLHSRSAGLLEVAGSHSHADPERDRILEVQFIHQTVKEYMTTGPGRVAILQEIGDERHDSGYILIFRYLVSLLTSFEERNFDIDAQKFVIFNFEHYAHEIEDRGMESAGGYLEPVILQLTEAQRRNILTQIIDQTKMQAWSGTLNRMRGRSWAQLLLLYTLLSLEKSLVQSKQRYIDNLTAEHRQCLLLAATEVSTSIAETNEDYSIVARILNFLQKWGPGDDHT